MDKNAFSLIEVLIATTLLSIVMLSLFEMKSNNIHLLEKSKESEKAKAYLYTIFNDSFELQRNETIYLDKYFSIFDDEIRREFKSIKIEVKDETLNSKEKLETLDFDVNRYKTTYTLDNIKKDIYSFKIVY